MPTGDRWAGVQGRQEQRSWGAAPSNSLFLLTGRPSRTSGEVMVSVGEGTAYLVSPLCWASRKTKSQESGEGRTLRPLSLGMAGCWLVASQVHCPFLRCGLEPSLTMRGFSFGQNKNWHPQPGQVGTDGCSPASASSPGPPAVSRELGDLDPWAKSQLWARVHGHSVKAHSSVWMPVPVLPPSAPRGLLQGEDRGPMWGKGGCIEMLLQPEERGH